MHGVFGESAAFDIHFHGIAVNRALRRNPVHELDRAAAFASVEMPGRGFTEGEIVIAAPGLRATLADGVDMTVGASYRANMAFSRDAIHLLTRLPLMPEGGDMADDVMVVQDPISGLFFQVAMYRAYRSVLFEVAIAWGVKAAKPEHIAILLG